MSKTKKKYKGVRYVAKVLNKYFTKKYPRYTDALPKAREVYQQLKGQGQKVKVDNITALVRKKRKKGVPELPESLSSLSYYFELVNYPQYIIQCTNQIWFQSEISPEGLDIFQGGKPVDYETYFSDYVNFINSAKASTLPEEKMYETEWMVTCTTPELGKGKNKGKWISKIISVDGAGDKIDYGFDPKNPQQKSITPISAQKPTPKPTTTPEPPKTAAEPIKPISSTRSIDELKAETELEKQKEKTLRQENISQLMKMFTKGDISKLELKEMLSLINKS